MTTLAGQRRAPRIFDAAALLRVAVAAGLSLVTALAVAEGLAFFMLLALAVGVGVLVAARGWRWCVYGLLLYIPFSGIPVILSYPKTGLPVLIKDLVFVLPAYLGFAGYHVARRKSPSFEGAPVRLLGMFALLVTLQALNPDLPNRLVGAVGMKVWLLYVPLLFLGYHFVRDRRDLFRALGLMSLAAVVPAVIGIVEAALIAGGRETDVYSLYGSAAGPATQNFASTGYVGGGVLYRVPSTFTFIAQYYTFTASMVVVAYAWWRGSSRGPVRYLAGAVWLLMITAGFLSGARGAFVFIPLLVVLTVVLERGPIRLPIVRLAAPVVALVVAMSVVGARPATVVSHAVAGGASEFHSVFLDGLRTTFSASILGQGSGIDSNGSRHVLSAQQRQDVAARGQESWYVKAAVELGVAGFVVVLALVATLLALGVRSHRRLRDPGLRAVSASLLAFLIWNALYGFKAPYIDLDPINVYFWLFAGVLFKLPALERPEPAVAPGPAGAAA